MRATTTIPVLLTFALAAPLAAQSWNGSVLEIDCAGVESVGGTIAKERRCMEVAARSLLAEKMLCTPGARAAGRCPPPIVGESFFPKPRLQECTDQDIPGDRGRCLYGRGADTFAVAGCLAKNDPVSCCSAAGAGSCPALPTCDSAEWGHVSRDLETSIDTWCDGTSWEVTTQQVPTWHPSYFEAADRKTVATLSTCDTANEGLAEIVTDGSGAADCTVGLSSNVHRCRCLSSVWTAEAGEYQIWPPSSALLSVPATGGLPPCGADTNNLRAWVGPFADAARPWLDGVLWRCSNPTWAENVGTYRVAENDDGLGDVARPWCRDQRNCWFMAPPDAANSWIEDQGRDRILRDFESIFLRRRDDGQRKINDQRVPPAEAN